MYVPRHVPRHRFYTFSESNQNITYHPITIYRTIVILSNIGIPPFLKICYNRIVTSNKVKSNNKTTAGIMHKILRLPEVMRNTGLARSTIYKMIAEKIFPNQISLGVKSVGWLESDIQNWIQEKISQSNAAQKSVNQ